MTDMNVNFINMLSVLVLFLSGALAVLLLKSSNNQYRVAVWLQANARKLDQMRAAKASIDEEARVFQRRLESQLLEPRDKPSIVEIAER